jgi:anthranilate 1,2-dioxygenase small subunit
MSGTNTNLLQRIDELQLRYIDALDSKQMGAWLETFAAEASYVCKTFESEAAGWDVALIMDDCRGRLEDRVKFVEKVWAGTFQDYQTRHFVQRVECTPGVAGAYQVRSNFTVVFTRSDTGHTDILAAGVYHDVIDVSGDQPAFRSKRVVMDAPKLPHYIVYPL